MKKILIIASWYPSFENPILGPFFREQAELFASGFDIKILCGVKKSNIRRCQKLFNSVFFILFKKVTFRLKDNYFLSPPSVFGFEYEVGINALNKNNYKITKKAYLQFFKYYVFKNWKPDLIHSHNYNIAGIIAKEIYINFNIPFINTDHHPFNPKLPNYYLEDLKIVFNLAKRNLFISQWQYRTYLLLDKNLIGQIIGNPVNSDFFIIKERESGMPFTIIHISNAILTKDIITLFKAFELFFNNLKHYDTIRIKIIGFPMIVIDFLYSIYGYEKWYERLTYISPSAKEIIRDELTAIKCIYFFECVRNIWTCSIRSINVWHTCYCN